MYRTLFLIFTFSFEANNTLSDYRHRRKFKAGDGQEGGIFRDQLASIQEQTNNCSYEGVEDILEALRKAKERLNANVNFDLTMELLFLTIKENITE